MTWKKDSLVTRTRLRCCRNHFHVERAAQGSSRRGWLRYQSAIELTVHGAATEERAEAVEQITDHGTSLGHLEDEADGRRQTLPGVGLGLELPASGARK